MEISKVGTCTKKQIESNRPILIRRDFPKQIPLTHHKNTWIITMFQSLNDVQNPTQKGDILPSKLTFSPGKLKLGRWFISIWEVYPSCQVLYDCRFVSLSRDFLQDTSRKAWKDGSNINSCRSTQATNYKTTYKLNKSHTQPKKSTFSSSPKKKMAIIGVFFSGHQSP